ncbi:MAG: hypothetical protein ACKOX6_17175 [Bdellovibrio sp.]
MKALRFLLKYSVLFLVTFGVTCLLSLGVASYYVVNHIQSAPRNSDYNLTAVLKIGEGYIQELNTFDSIYKGLQDKKMPPFCTTLCGPAAISQSQLIQERTPYLASYYQTNGTKSFKDPLFRFKLEQMLLISKTIPDSLREVVMDILKQNSEQNKLLLALRLEKSILSTLPSWPERLQSYREGSNRLTLVRAWMKACQARGTPQKISQECRTEFP